MSNFEDFLGGPPSVLSSLSGTTSQTSGVLVAGAVYIYSATTATRIAIAASPTADTNSMIVPLGRAVRIIGDGVNKIAAIHADGSTAFLATVTRVG